ncbi:hypothetical protein [Marinobacter sp.]|uniref:hypothetical protein n=1 Tax=Marinobacter sp. TaxID=50741 RepID=UPI003B52FBE1
MAAYKPKSFLYMNAHREAVEFIKEHNPSSSFPARRRAASGDGVIGMGILDGATPGALVKQMNANHTDKGPYIYFLYTAEGTTELDSESVEAAIKAHNDKQSTLRRRSVTLTDADQDYLEKLGGGNISGGIRVAVEVLRRTPGFMDHLTFGN